MSSKKHRRRIKESYSQGPVWLNPVKPMANSRVETDDTLQKKLSDASEAEARLAYARMSEYTISSAKERLKQTNDQFLEGLKDFSVTFPEINSPPIPLGVPLEATISIGDDPPQPKRLIYATIILPMNISDIDLWQGCQSLSLDNQKKIITSLPARDQSQVSPVIKVLYPLPFPLGGFAMYPITMFDFYGKDIVVRFVKQF